MLILELNKVAGKLVKPVQPENVYRNILLVLVAEPVSMDANSPDGILVKLVQPRNVWTKFGTLPLWTAPNILPKSPVIDATFAELVEKLIAAVVVLVL